jgi:hypothetical protein
MSIERQRFTRAIEIITLHRKHKIEQDETPQNMNTIPGITKLYNICWPVNPINLFLHI